MTWRCRGDGWFLRRKGKRGEGEGADPAKREGIEETVVAGSWCFVFRKRRTTNEEQYRKAEGERKAVGLLDCWHTRPHRACPVEAKVLTGGRAVGGGVLVTGDAGHSTSFPWLKPMGGFRLFLKFNNGVWTWAGQAGCQDYCKYYDPANRAKP